MNAGRIVTVKEVKDLLGLDGAGDDAKIASLIEKASSWLEKFTNRTFRERTGIREFIDSRGGRFLWLGARPITTTTPLLISVDAGQDHDATQNHLTEELGVGDGDFVIDRNLGKVSLVGTGSFSQGPKAIRVDYSAGYLIDDIPQEAKLAAIYYVGYLLQKFETRSGLAQSNRTIPQGSVSLIQGVPAEIAEIARPLQLPGTSAGTGGFF